MTRGGYDRQRLGGVVDLSTWRGNVLRDIGSAGAPGVLLVLVSIGVTLLACVVLGVMMYRNQIVLPVRGKLVAFVLALPAIGLGLVTFYILAPFFYAWDSRRRSQAPGQAGGTRRY